MSIIAYAGKTGAYAQLAKEALFPNKNEYPCKNFTEVFKAVYEEKAVFGVVPIENNTGGPVWDTYQLLYDAQEINIVSEYFSPIHHNIIGFKETSLANVELIASHPQALAQCKKTLKKMCPKARMQSFSTTSEAIEYVKNEQNLKMIALGSKKAATFFDLPVLASEIQDNPENTTRFVVIQKNTSHTKTEIVNTVSTKTMTTLRFAISDETGSLAHALDVFSNHDINFLNLRNFLVGASFKPLRFYLEIEDLENKVYQEEALKKLTHSVEDFKIIGSYPQHIFREK